jgi:hypothetical protein
MSEELLDYYLFSIKFECVLCNWQPSWHSFKVIGGFHKVVLVVVGMKIYFCKVRGGFHKIIFVGCSTY